MAEAKRRSGAVAGADDRRRQPRGDARRRQIIDAAVELFAARGYRGTGIAPLAEKVGLTHPGLLYYFGTKERLLAEVVAEREQGETDAFADVHDDWASLVQAARFNVSSPSFLRLFVVLAAENLDADDPLHDFFVRRYSFARYLIRRVLVTEFGDAVAPVAHAVSAEVLATLMGLEIQWLMDPGCMDLVAAIEAYTDALHGRLERLGSA